MNDYIHIHCSQAGCQHTLTIDARHAGNFEGRDWYCRTHGARHGVRLLAA